MVATRFALVVLALAFATPAVANDPYGGKKQLVLACTSKDALGQFERASNAQDFDTTLKLSHEHRCKYLRPDARLSVLGRDGAAAKVRVEGRGEVLWVDGAAAH